jgi:hypothetical protein
MTSNTQIPCLICQQPLVLRLTKGRKSGKPSLMLICPQDGRHFRGFITLQSYVRQVLARLEGQTPSLEGGADVDSNPRPSNRTRTNPGGGNG